MSFFSKLESYFSKIFGSPSVEKTISAAITLVAPLLETVVGLTAGEGSASEVASIISEVQSDLGVVSVLASQIATGGSGVKAQMVNVINTIQANLSALLSAGHIKNADTLNKVTTIFGTVSGELKAVLSVLA